MTEFVLPPHRIEGLVPCDSRVVGSVIGVRGTNLNTIRQTVGDGCFIRYEDSRLPRQQCEGYFYIQANSHESVGNAIFLLREAEREARRKILDNRPQVAQKRRPRKPITTPITEWPTESKVVRLPPRKVEAVPLEPGTVILKKERA